ncbi:MAG: SRPBCC family protein [Caldilineaceae bacterium]|nr:SRPBCC family protein [Caldilineaceae bacterium]
MNTTSNRELVMSRVFAAAPELVWLAWTSATHIDQWWGPDGFRNETLAMEVRPGGMWRYIMHGPDGVDYPNRVIYHEVVALERLVYHHGNDIDDDPTAFHVTVTFVPQGNETLLTMHMRFPTAAQRQEAIGYGAIEGGQQTLGRLAAYLPQMALSAGETLANNR